MKAKSRLDLNLLIVFNAVFENRSVTDAAKELHLTQSTISHALGRLRHVLNDQLFVRTSAGLMPTATARALIEPIRASLRGIDAAIAQASHFDEKTSSRLFQIGLRPSSETRLFANLAALCARRAPTVRLASVVFRRGDLERSLLQGDIDVAVDVASKATSNLQSTELYADTIVVAARRGSPFAKGVADLGAYLEADHVLVSQRPAGMGFEDEALANLGHCRSIGVRCQDISSAWRIVAESDRILSLSKSEAAILQNWKRLHLSELPFECAPPPLKLYWHAISELDPGHAWLRSLVRQAFDDMAK